MTTRKVTRTEPVIEAVRNPTATTTGAGVALVFGWVYNSILVPRLGLPEMPQEVQVVLSLFIVDAVRYLMTKDKLVEEVVVEPKVAGGEES